MTQKAGINMHQKKVRQRLPHKLIDIEVVSKFQSQNRRLKGHFFFCGGGGWGGGIEKYHTPA